MLILLIVEHTVRYMDRINSTDLYCTRFGHHVSMLVTLSVLNDISAKHIIVGKIPFLVFCINMSMNDF